MDILSKVATARKALPPAANGKTTSTNGPTDLPAAHSADTDWFAVDKDGQVAHFYSSDNGPIPECATDPAPVRAALTENSGQDVLAHWEKDPLSIQNGIRTLVLDDLRPRPRSPIIYDIANYLDDDFGPAVRVQLVDLDEGVADVANVVMILRTASIIRAELASGEAVLLPQTPPPPPAIVRFTKISTATLDRLLHSGASLYCTNDPYDMGEEEDNFPRLGLFSYKHRDNYFNPYSRLQLPAQPMHVDQLSPVTRAIAMRVRLENQSFTDARLLQPLRHWRCQGFQSNVADEYLDEDGRTWWRLGEQIQSGRLAEPDVEPIAPLKRTPPPPIT